MNPEDIVISKRDRLIILALVALEILGIIVVGTIALRAQTIGTVRLDISKAEPREVEAQTENAIVRDYGAAWKSYSAALSTDNPAALGDLWVGFARQNCLDAIEAQQRSGVRLRYLDRGHDLQAMFYSQEGSALELHDTAQLERQVVDGSSVISAENITQRFVVIMTPAADHWQVRLIEEVPNF